MNAKQTKNENTVRRTYEQTQQDYKHVRYKYNNWNRLNLTLMSRTINISILRFCRVAMQKTVISVVFLQFKLIFSMNYLNFRRIKE